MLIIYNNEISEISGLENLTNLRELCLLGNNIKQISGLNHCTNLGKLDLSMNPIAKIEGLENLDKLHTLILEDTDIPKDFIDTLGGMDSNGDIYEPQRFVEYCKQHKKGQ